MRVEFHPAADDEFAAQVDYFDSKEAGLGGRFYDEVMNHLNWIIANATVPRDRGSHRRVNLKIFPFYIAYAVENDLIRVFAVAHGHRKPGYWKRRLAQ